MHDPSPWIALPKSRQERWQLLTELIGQWYSPLSKTDGYSREEIDEIKENNGLSLPLALIEWYELAGKRADIWSRQDEFLPPTRVYENCRRLIIYVENQAVVTWGIPIDLLTSDDPPVDVESVDEEGVWLRQCNSISSFALFIFAYNLMFAKTRWWVYGFAQPELVNGIADAIPRLEFPNNWWTGTRLFGYQDLVVSIDSTDHLHASALSAKSLESFTDLTTETNFEMFAAWNKP